MKTREPHGRLGCGHNPKTYTPFIYEYSRLKFMTKINLKNYFEKAWKGIMSTCWHRWENISVPNVGYLKEKLESSMTSSSFSVCLCSVSREYASNKWCSWHYISQYPGNILSPVFRNYGTQEEAFNVAFILISRKFVLLWCSTPRWRNIN